MNTNSIGKTSLGHSITAHRFGYQGPKVFILGGVHGDEREGVDAALGLTSFFLESFTLQLRVTVIPMFNLDGVLRCSRTNANGVDLNRNLPTADWSAEVKNPRYNPGPSANSEPENQALVRTLQDDKPDLIISLHSYIPQLNINGDCRAVAEVIAKHTGYPITESIGYPTPGCLGTYAGLERDIPTITYEVERGSSTQDVLKLHIPAVYEGLKFFERWGAGYGV